LTHEASGSPGPEKRGPDRSHSEHSRGEGLSGGGSSGDGAPRKRRRRGGRGRGRREGGQPSSGGPPQDARFDDGDEGSPRREAHHDDFDERREVDRTHKTYSGGFSTMGLSDVTLHALAAAGYEEPSPIQAGLIPRALTGVDVLGQARTGTGKTASFVLPILEKLDPHHAHAHPQALVLVPTRELAVQVKDEFEKLARGRKAHILAVYGGKPIRGQVEKLQRGAEVVVGTPGRVLDHMARGTLVLDNLKLTVLDEADRMLDIGFLPDIEKILRRCPQSRQTLLLSATVPPPIEKLARRFMRDPEIQNFSPQSISGDTIEQHYFTVDQDKKFELLVRLLKRENPQQSIIFCRTKRGVDKIQMHLEKKIPGTACIHGDLPQSARDRVMKAFRDNQVTHLVATDVVGRGIDVTNISHIINYDVPAFCDDYVHRVGRTGRMGREGVAFTFVTPEEGAELTRIEIRIEKLLKRDEIEGFEASRKRGQSDVEGAQAQAAAASTKYIQSDTGVAAQQPTDPAGPPKSPPKKKYRRAL
jgi:ATP-dependent RNA helicase DeaD